MFPTYPEVQPSLLARALAALIVFLLVVGCTAPPAKSPAAALALCEAGALAHARTRVERECDVSGFDACPTKHAIESELQENQEACK